MSSKEKLQKAMAFAMANRPKIGGFPYLAECLRKAGVTRNIWTLPAAQSLYSMSDGNPLVIQGSTLVTGMTEVPNFNQEALIKALRADQNGESTFPEFLNSSWTAGVVSYEVDFDKRVVTYSGVTGESYTESYPVVEVSDLDF